ncbi:chorismate synthase [Mobiluncus mulieris ATCC 35239]|uniref:Chorismate synthase n=2 Tax=Mobiluncus mulieris TaxID=2052 RepID=E0QRL6_9ACTO|nr:chorismate synthase [Mobiluncus mulieris ATCC 35239]MCU9970239.1 chorismate synthase [Mobiluncus mulieris]MCU9974702.1 chorismate synthase [Mobiluncus mulieris]MCU9993727.1 chorismate synthase [Mobiluncus mulieris]MCV0008421.1 chorismate synthase [Mobiluncus mulieris]
MGAMLQCVTAGESHGSALIAVCSGLPAGIEFGTADLEHALARRRLGYGRGARQKFEQDCTRILSGLRHGKTLGSPLAIEIQNSEWCKWTAVMSPDRVPPEELLVDAGKGDSREVARNKILTKPRPGHADFAGMLKYGFTDARNVLERSSARETAARVALGAVAEALLAQVAGIHLVSHVVSLGDISVPDDAAVPSYADTEALDENPMRCFDAATSDKMVARLEAAKQSGDTLGGLVEVLAYGVPVGLGSYVSADRRLDARLAAAVVSIQAIKGVEIGRAFRQAALPGSQAHDPIYLKSEQAPHESEKTNVSCGVWRPTNLAGGIEGGMSNGSPIVVRAPVKPISTVPQALPTVDLATGQPAVGLHQRSDTTAVVPAAVIAQAEVAVVLASALLEKTGGDSVAEAKRNLEAYLGRLRERTSF